MAQVFRVLVGFLVAFGCAAQITDDTGLSISLGTLFAWLLVVIYDAGGKW